MTHVRSITDHAVFNRRWRNGQDVNVENGKRYNYDQSRGDRIPATSCNEALLDLGPASSSSYHRSVASVTKEPCNKTATPGRHEFQPPVYLPSTHSPASSSTNYSMTEHRDVKRNSEIFARDRETGETQDNLELRPAHPGRPPRRPTLFKIPSSKKQRTNACERGTCEICRKEIKTPCEGSVNMELPVARPPQRIKDYMPDLQLRQADQVTTHHWQTRRSSSPKVIVHSQAKLEGNGKVRHVGHIELSNDLYSYLQHESLTKLTSMSRDASKQHTPFRIPSELSFELSKRTPLENNRLSSKKSVNIPCWREFIMGRDAVIDQSRFSEKLISKYKTSIPCFAIKAVLEKYLYQPMANIAYVICFLFMVFLPCISLALAFFYRLHIHRQIHARSEDLGVEVQYTGSPLEGPQAPLIYCIRHQSCAQCRHIREAELHRKYHERVLEERNKNVL
ncbi:uncharacterized protein LOC143038323 [Oratosquilla oratoria]|uniref:uncharacterized protein LOC143038323 n=1 Tax=Oratosquilla oratoria TaxID=337810 RepID=UPI003F767905